ncbi:pentapeptide repeat-containing protein [Streptomyces sp. NPDC006012]|uniref:pentapeptide repeat-containing protein n=1 Tax=Streptomyces sp. NPDC006012 TaxID=3364739 RepID=UPI0036777532
MLTRLREPATGRALLGQVEFDEARFAGDVTFEQIDFSGFCSFGTAVFGGSAYFRDTNFGQDLRFGNAEVAGELWLEDTAVAADAWFYGARIGGVLRFCVDRVGGSVMFKGVTTGEAHFTGVRFLGVARFDGMVIDGTAYFDGAFFEDGADFQNAVIAGPAFFDGAHFHRSRACFDGAELREEILFSESHFQTGVTFDGAKVGGDVAFCQARLEGDVSFRRAVFRSTAMIGPLVCPGLVDLSDAVFESAVTLEAAAGRLRCRRTRWASTAALRLRHATVDISDAVLEFPVTVEGRSGPFVSPVDEPIDELGLADARVRVISVSGVDVAHLVLANVDLTGCRFVETVHLDQLRLEGRCVLPLPPTGVSRRGWFPVRWTRRRTLAEEHHWRATRYGAVGWTPAPEGVETHEPAVLAPVYRQLRKALEDGKNEPGAADFYYGEMEMRRHDSEAPRGERMILGLYWAVSGYGLRAVRALAWLGLATTATVLAMMLWGLPQDDPDPVSKGRIDDRSVTLTTKTPDPVNPEGPYRRRLSTARFEQSLRVVANSVIFRASGQDLTTAGTYVEMATRLVEPALLGLAVLAVRSRVRR